MIAASSASSSRNPSFSRRAFVRCSLVAAATLTACWGLSGIAADFSSSPTRGLMVGEELPTGKRITPAAASGALFQDLRPGTPKAADLRAGQAAAVAVSPDGALLAILTSGFNRYRDESGRGVPELSTEYLFLFDVSAPQPRQLQAIALANTYQGLAWAPTSDRIFVSGGSDDSVMELTRRGSTWEPGRVIPLGHRSGVGLHAKPEAGGLAVNREGTRLLVTNFQNDSVSLIDLARGQILAEQDLRPGIIDSKRRGQSGGSFPRSVVWTSADRAYVASERDREVIVLGVLRDKVSVVRRMPVHGQPVGLLANWRARACMRRSIIRTRSRSSIPGVRS